MEGLEIGIIAAMSSILFLSFFGNFILCVVVHKQLPCQAVRNYSYLILNLAVSDILLAGSSIPFDIIQRIKTPIFPFGPTMCKLLWPFQTICSMASIFTVGALSFQRYRLVVRPLKGKLPRRRFFIMLASIWLLPVFLAGLPYSFVLRFDRNTSSCFENWIPETEQARMKLSFTTYLFIIQYVLPLGLIVWCNVKAILKLKRYLKYRKRTSIICALSIEHHENTVKMLTTIMAVFALFWLPGQVMAFLLEFESDSEFILKYGADIGYLFVFANCVMNPLIFAYFTQCHKQLPILRKLTSTSSINPTSACELGYSTFRRESEESRKCSSQPNHRRGSLPGNIKRVPLAKSVKRPSLPAILQSEDLTDKQRQSLLANGGNKQLLTPKRKIGILPPKSTLPALSEIHKSDSIPPTKNGELPTKLQNGCLQTEMQKQTSIPGSRKRLSFSIQKQDPSNSLTRNSDFISNVQNDTRSSNDITKGSQKRMPTEKRPSLSILKKRDSLVPGMQRGNQGEKHGDVDAGVMRNFLEIIKTMKEDVLRNYLDATPETVLN